MSNKNYYMHQYITIASLYVSQPMYQFYADWFCGMNVPKRLANYGRTKSVVLYDRTYQQLTNVESSECCYDS